MNKIIWHITGSSINVFNQSESYTFSVDHPMYPFLISALGVSKDEVIIEAIEDYQKHLDLLKVSRMLGVSTKTP